ncbi:MULTISPECIES: xanthine dehydrogenase family protein molybdopterin-binding subunit [Cobetia]|uniref:xanthine dehydrogenase family protein molybdopterin-binding subunit n=1 Tax=Cobetia TaxID=204286 RepID=UPI0009858248|nr:MULTISPECIES: molybdopterin cofactor-binding domain-containing protein [Cobetia]POR06677.1 aldehyde dehydrogenase [Cobetia sp. MM1IDA2H-1]
MSRNPLPDRRALLTGTDILVVYRDPVIPPKPAPGQPGTHSDFIPTEPEIFLAICADGRVMAFNGHVDLGTGIRTSLAQIVAEELELPCSRVDMILGHPFDVPNQGPTIASATIQITADPLRRAAAQAREYLLDLAATHLNLPRDGLRCSHGRVLPKARDASPEHGTRGIDYGELLQGRRHALKLEATVLLKPPGDYRIVGKAASRVDIPEKATGQLTFVHDMRLPDMLHGAVIRPPYTGHDKGTFVNNCLIKVDRGSVKGMPGLVDIVVIGDFVGVVAEREEQAAAIAKRLEVTWREDIDLPSLHDIPSALAALPASHRPLLSEGDADSVLASAPHPLERTYVWPFQLHGSIGPSCSLANFREGSLTLWSGTQNPHSLRADLSRLLDLDESRITITRMEAAGCYGRNCADDVGADAALLSRAIGRPVRVQLSRAQEHAWEPKGAAQLMTVAGASDEDGNPLAYRFTSRYPSNDAPTLALLLTGAVAPSDIPFEMGDRTAVPPYRYEHRDIRCDDVPTLVRASWFRGVSAMPNTFAHESFIDELAYLADQDPVAYRLDALSDPRAVELTRRVAAHADWEPRVAFSAPLASQDGWLYGRGVAYAQYVHSRYPGFGAALAAWIVELKVHPDSGRIVVTRLTIGQDAGLMINPAGVRHQVHGNVIQTLSRTLKERIHFEDGKPSSREWGSYPILRFSEIPDIEVVLLEDQNQPPLGVGESTSLPGAPAIANALFDATGVRFLAPPFTPEVVRQTLQKTFGSI